MNKKVGFIGAGYMGFGIAKNILKNDFSLKVIAHKNRAPIEKLLKLGASEAKTYDELSKDIDCLFICVTNTKIAKEIASSIVPKLKKEILFIDITTHKKNGSIEMENILKSNKNSPHPKSHVEKFNSGVEKNTGYEPRVWQWQSTSRPRAPPP